MEYIKYPKPSNWANLTKRATMDDAKLEKQVKIILEDVRLNGDEALEKFLLQFDNVKLKTFTVTEQEFDAAEKNTPKNLKLAIALARHNIEKFHEMQQEEPKIVETISGVKCWRKSIAIEKVGLYIPGGSAPNHYFDSDCADKCRIFAESYFSDQS